MTREIYAEEGQLKPVSLVVEGAGKCIKRLVVNVDDLDFLDECFFR